MGTDAYIGRLLAQRYAIIEQIGEGGMARVYRGRHVTLGRPVAVKILRDVFASRASFVGRFLREARATARIHHPNVVEVLDFGQEPDGTVYCVMELLEGEPLSETLVHEGRLSWERAKPVMLQVCDALSAAHEQGVVHRDVKPDNCLRLTSGPTSAGEDSRPQARDAIKLIDFGIAKMASRDDDPLPGGRTAQGTVMGTADYIAPEQARGSHTDHRTDVYGAGVLMYELLTGQVPFAASTSLDVLAQHMYVVPQPPSRVAPLAHIPPEADAIVLRALSKDPESRFQTIEEMRVAIEALEFDEPQEAMPQAASIESARVHERHRVRWAVGSVFGVIVTWGIASSFSGEVVTSSVQAVQAERLPQKRFDAPVSSRSAPAASPDRAVADAMAAPLRPIPQTPARRVRRAPPPPPAAKSAQRSRPAEREPRKQLEGPEAFVEALTSAEIVERLGLSAAAPDDGT